MKTLYSYPGGRAKAIMGLDLALVGDTTDAVQRVGHKARRPSMGPTLEELAAMPSELSLLLFGVAVFSTGRWVLHHPDGVDSLVERLFLGPRPAPRRPRAALGSGVVTPLGGSR